MCNAHFPYKALYFCHTIIRRVKTRSLLMQLFVKRPLKGGIAAVRLYPFFYAQAMSETAYYL